MNCPGACLVFASERHSYRDLPLRLAEFGDVSRYEREGVLHGLLRVRAFTQDDAHVYCTLEQVPDEVDSICEAIDELYARFGFDQVRVELSTRPEKSIGTDEQWERADRGPARGARAPGPRVRREPGGGDLLRAEDRLPRHRRARALVAVRHLPARLLHARALRAHLPGRGQRRAPAGDDPPRAARLDGALRRDPDRAPRRPLPGLAGAGAGGGPAGLRPAPRLRAARSRRSSPRPGCGCGSTSARSRSGERSATPSSPRSRSCSSSASASSDEATVVGALPRARRPRRGRDRRDPGAGRGLSRPAEWWRGAAAQAGGKLA